MTFDWHDLGHGIVLEKVRPGDAGEILRLVDSCRPYLGEWMPWVERTRTIEDVETFVESALKQDAENNGFQCAIRVGGKLAGIIGYAYVNRGHLKTEIGYWLGETYQGRGIMTRAARALTDHAFSGLGLNRVEIRVAEGNRKSRAIAERLGFRQEGVLREAEWVRGRALDSVVYGMLRREWTREE